MIAHLKERLEYAREELAWLEAGAPGGKEPWREWELCKPDGDWRHCASVPLWVSLYEYRRRPRTITINGIEVPEPLREAPETGTEVWVADPTPASMCFSFTWGGEHFDKRMLKRGLLHPTKEAARTHARALIAASGGVE